MSQNLPAVPSQHPTPSRTLTSVPPLSDSTPQLTDARPALSDVATPRLRAVNPNQTRHPIPPTVHHAGTMTPDALSRRHRALPHLGITPTPPTPTDAKPLTTTQPEAAPSTAPSQREPATASASAPAPATSSAAPGSTSTASRAAVAAGRAESPAAEAVSAESALAESPTAAAASPAESPVGGSVLAESPVDSAAVPTEPSAASAVASAAPSVGSGSGAGESTAGERTVASRRGLAVVPVAAEGQAAGVVSTDARNRGATAGPGLPDPRAWGGRLAQAVSEVLAGDRPISQLVRFTDETVFADLSRRVRLLGLTTTATARGAKERSSLRSVRVCTPAREIAEVAAHVRHGERSRAIALRLEIRRNRWVCTALEIG
ncbi:MULTISPECIES: Rv3235 family protein [unclassified Kribbella]|uniref:Rv3235 family protein n=1 Tax=unclassified Kribbella TaxID=2644121 RepID=UPI00301A0D02